MGHLYHGYVSHNQRVIVGLQPCWWKDPMIFGISPWRVGTSHFNVARICQCQRSPLYKRSTFSAYRYHRYQKSSEIPHAQVISGIKGSVGMAMDCFTFREATRLFSAGAWAKRCQKNQCSHPGRIYDDWMGLRRETTKRIETVAMSKVDHCDKPWDSGAVSVWWMPPFGEVC